MVVHFREYVNTYGSFAGFWLGFLVRLLGGEPYIGVPAIIHYPFFDEEHNQQNFPFRTVAMLVSLTSLIVFSAMAKFLFTKGIISQRYDIFECFTSMPPTKCDEMQELATDNSTYHRNVTLPKDEDYDSKPSEFHPLNASYTTPKHLPNGDKV